MKKGEKKQVVVPGILRVTAERLENLVRVTAVGVPEPLIDPKPFNWKGFTIKWDNSLPTCWAQYEKVFVLGRKATSMMADKNWANLYAALKAFVRTHKSKSKTTQKSSEDTSEKGIRLCTSGGKSHQKGQPHTILKEMHKDGAVVQSDDPSPSQIIKEGVVGSKRIIGASEVDLASRFVRELIDIERDYDYAIHELLLNMAEEHEEKARKIRDMLLAEEVEKRTIARLRQVLKPCATEDATNG